MADDLSLSLVITGTDESASAIADARKNIDALVQAVQRSQAAFTDAGKALAASFTPMVESVSAAEKAVAQLRASLTGDTAAIRGAAGGMFAPIAESAESSTRAATTSFAGMAGSIREELATFKQSLTGAFSPIVEGMTTAADAVKAGAASMDTALDATLTQVRTLGAELRGLKMPGGRSGPFKAASGSGVGGALRSGGSAALGALGLADPVVDAGIAIGGSVYEGVDQRHEAAKAVLTGGFDPNKEIGLAVGEMQRRIQDSASAVTQSYDDVADAYVRGSRMLQGLDPKQRLSTIEGILPNASYEASMKDGTSLGEAVQAMVELTHQMGEYSPDAIKKMTGQFAVASLNSNASLDQITNQSSYFLPQLRASLGLDFGSGISAEVAAMNAGLQRSGTSIRDYTESLFAKTGKGSKDHNDALQQLGLIDKYGKPVWQVRGKDGKVDYAASWANAGSITEKAISGMDDTTKESLLKHAFGEQGGRFGALLATGSFRDQLAGIKSRIDAGTGNGDMLGQLRAADPSMQFKQDWVDLKNVLSDLGSVVLPPLVITLKGIDAVLVTVHKGFSELFDLFGKWSTPSGSHGRQMPDSPPEAGRNLGLLHKSAYIEGADTDDGNPFAGAIGSRMGWDAAMLIWASTANDTKDAKAAITGPVVDHLTSIDTAVQGIGAGLAAAISKFMGGTDGSGGGFVNASYEGGSGAGASGYNDTSGGSDGKAPTGSLLQRGKTAMAKLMALGMSKEAAAAAVGNFQQESGITPDGRSGDHGTAHGLAQWRFERFAALKAYAAKMGKSWTDLDAQLRFFVDEAKKRGGAGWMTGHSVEAANEGMQRFERYGDHSGGTRLGNARRWNGIEPSDAEAIASQGLGSRGGGIHHHGDVVVNVHGDKDPAATARKVTRAIEAQFRDRTHDVDWDT